jgi:hypothetical protein
VNVSNSKGSIERLCAQCGNAFKTKPCWIRKGFGKYCSKPCADAALKVSPVTRFWASVDKSGGDDACWPWTAGKEKRGYGRLFVNGRNVTTSRFSFELHKGPIPNGLFVLHRCDNPPCCNPAHLFLGTLTDNSADMVSKGRQAKGENHGSRTHPGAVKKAITRGEKHHAAKLNRHSAQEIVSLYRQGGITMQRLADKYGVHLVTVCDVIHGKTWGDHTGIALSSTT